MTQPVIADSFGRTPLADGMKRQIEDMFSVVPTQKRGALIVIADERGARLQVAAKLNGTWKVAAGAGVTIEGWKSSAWIGLIGIW